MHGVQGVRGAGQMTTLTHPTRPTRQIPHRPTRTRLQAHLRIPRTPVVGRVMKRWTAKMMATTTCSPVSLLRHWQNLTLVMPWVNVLPGSVPRHGGGSSSRCRGCRLGRGALRTVGRRMLPWWRNTTRTSRASLALRPSRRGSRKERANGALRRRQVEKLLLLLGGLDGCRGVPRPQ